MGMVLLDVDDGECDAVGLEERGGGGNIAGEGLESGFQLYWQFAEFQWVE